MPHPGHMADERMPGLDTHRHACRAYLIYQHIRQMRQHNISNIKIAQPA